MRAIEFTRGPACLIAQRPLDLCANTSVVICVILPPKHRGKVTVPTAAMVVLVAFGTSRLAWSCPRLVRQPEAGQCHAGEADAEFLQRRAARDRLRHVLGEFIELVVHTDGHAFVFWCEVVTTSPVR